MILIKKTKQGDCRIIVPDSNQAALLLKDKRYRLADEKESQKNESPSGNKNENPDPKSGAGQEKTGFLKGIFGGGGDGHDDDGPGPDEGAGQIPPAASPKG